MLEVNPKRRLTAGQTLQHDWLQYAAAQKYHKGVIKATDSTAESPNQQKLSRQVENKRDSIKPEMLAGKSHTAHIYENILNNNYEPDINMHDRDQPIQVIQNMTSNQQNASHAEDTTTTTTTTNKQYTSDQHKPEKPAQQEDTDTKQE